MLATHPPESMCFGMSLHYAYFQSCAPCWISPVLVVKVRGLLQKVIPWDYHTLWLPSGSLRTEGKFSMLVNSARKTQRCSLAAAAFAAPLYHGCNICCPIKQQLQLELCPGLDHFIASSSCTVPRALTWVGPPEFLTHHQVSLLLRGMSCHSSIKWLSHLMVNREVIAPLGGKEEAAPSAVLCGTEEWGKMLKWCSKGFWIWEHRICCGTVVFLSIGNAAPFSRTELGKKLGSSGRQLNLTSKNLGFELPEFKAEVGSETCSWKEKSYQQMAAVQAGNGNLSIYICCYLPETTCQQTENIHSKFLKLVNLRCQHTQGTNSRSFATLQDSRSRVPTTLICKSRLQKPRLEGKRKIEIQNLKVRFSLCGFWAHKRSHFLAILWKYEC